MAELSKDQLLYLLYALSYSDKTEGNIEDKTVTKSTVKEHLFKQNIEEDPEKIYEYLLNTGLIKATNRGRFLVTNVGISSLVINLQKNTNCRFDVSASKGRLLNSLIYCLNLTSGVTSLTPEMDFDTFLQKFKDTYFKERKRQEIDGVVVIRRQEIAQNFMQNNSISKAKLDEYFDRLKSTGKIFVAAGKDDELVNWVE
jgi:hypothetical protein